MLYFYWNLNLNMLPLSNFFKNRRGIFLTLEHMMQNFVLLHDLLFDNYCKSLVICVVFAMHFCSPFKVFIDISDIGMVKKMSLYMCWFFYHLCELFACKELFCQRLHKRQPNYLSEIPLNQDVERRANQSVFEQASRVTELLQLTWSLASQLY